MSWPEWGVIDQRWAGHVVPRVRVVPFELAGHFPGLRWLYNSTGRQLFGTPNPTESTAYHIAVLLADASEELWAAYCLFAYLHQDGMNSVPLKVLEPVFERNGTDMRGWWNWNARALLPPISDPSGRKHYSDRATTWSEVVDSAANTWKGVASEFSIVRVPDLMDLESAEYRAYVEHVSEASLRQERAEYERLKKKFEP